MEIIAHLYVEFYSVTKGKNLLIDKIILIHLKNYVRETVVKIPYGRVLVAYTCNPSYSGGRDPFSKIPSTKKVPMEWLK
jgi:hypothetical protein